MIHSLSGGVITQYDTLLYAFVQIDQNGPKRWFISPFIFIKPGDRVEVPVNGGSGFGCVLRVEKVTAQTAPFPVKRTAEIVRILN